MLRSIPPVQECDANEDDEDEMPGQKQFLFYQHVAILNILVSLTCAVLLL
jgi:hypothetical protein